MRGGREKKTPKNGRRSQQLQQQQQAAAAAEEEAAAAAAAGGGGGARVTQWASKRERKKGRRGRDENDLELFEIPLEDENSQGAGGGNLNRRSNATGGRLGATNLYSLSENGACLNRFLSLSLGPSLGLVPATNPITTTLTTEPTNHTMRACGCCVGSAVFAEQCS